MLYFDHSATTPPHKDVVRTVSEIMENYYGNPSSLHRLGVEAEKLVEKARKVIAASLKVHPDTLIFTSGGTESNNTAIKGIALKYQNRGKHVITTEIEHASVYDCFKQLEMLGFEVTYLPVDASGTVNIEDLKKSIRDDTILVSIMYVNNEVGTIQPIDKIGQLLKQYPKLFFHVDAVQAIGKIPVKIEGSGIDLLSVSAHKIQGPKGIGFLYCRSSIQLFPLLAGGGQENGRRSGTENVPLIVGMAKAVRIALENQKRTAERLYHLRKLCIDKVKQISSMMLNGPENMDAAAPHIVHYTVPHIKSEVLLHALEQRGIYVSTRSACSSSDDKPSRVLLAMGRNRDEAASGIRISLGTEHTEKDIAYLTEQIRSVLQQLVRTTEEQGEMQR